VQLFAKKFIKWDERKPRKKKTCILFVNFYLVYLSPNNHSWILVEMVNNINDNHNPSLYFFSAFSAEAVLE